jgi:hypothetical protein
MTRGCTGKDADTGGRNAGCAGRPGALRVGGRWHACGGRKKRADAREAAEVGEKPVGQPRSIRAGEGEEAAMRSMAQIWAGSRLLCRGSGPTAGCPGGVAGGLRRLAGGAGPAAARLGTSGGEGGADREKNCKDGAARPRPCLVAGPTDLVRGIGRGRPRGAGAQGPVGGGVASEVRALPVRCLRPLPGYRARAPPEAAAHAGQRRITARSVGAAARAPPGAAPRRRCAWPGGAEGAGRAGARETGGVKARGGGDCASLVEREVEPMAEREVARDSDVSQSELSRRSGAAGRSDTRPPFHWRSSFSDLAAEELDARGRGRGWLVRRGAAPGERGKGGGLVAGQRANRAQSLGEGGRPRERRLGLPGAAMAGGGCGVEGAAGGCRQGRNETLI